MGEYPDPTLTLNEYEEVILAGPEGVARAAAKPDSAADRSNISEALVDHLGATTKPPQETRAGNSSEDRDTVYVTIEFVDGPDGCFWVRPNVKDRSQNTGEFLIGKYLLRELSATIDINKEDSVPAELKEKAEASFDPVEEDSYKNKGW